MQMPGLGGNPGQPNGFGPQGFSLFSLFNHMFGSPQQQGPTGIDKQPTIGPGVSATGGPMGITPRQGATGFNPMHSALQPQPVSPTLTPSATGVPGLIGGPAGPAASPPGPTGVNFKPMASALGGQYANNPFLGLGI
jgi:hypothetical protein